MKKLLIIALIGVAAQFAKADSATVTIATGVFTNLISNGSALVSKFVLTSPANNTALVKIVDTPTYSLYGTNAAYVTTVSYATNVITCYTNYFGVQNCFTNVGLVQDANYTNAASFYAFPVMLQAAAGTNTSVQFSGVNYHFGRGIWVTNMGTGNATVSITYQR